MSFDHMVLDHNGGLHQKRPNPLCHICQFSLREEGIVGRFENPRCDGSGPHTMGEVRKFPINPGAWAHLCMACFSRENQNRYVLATIDPATGLRRPEPLFETLPQINWSAAEVYGDDDRHFTR